METRPARASSSPADLLRWYGPKADAGSILSGSIIEAGLCYLEHKSGAIERPMQDLDLIFDLKHVFWLGGSSCAGKTSIARLLAAAHGLLVYSCDDAFEAHRRRAR